MSEARERLAAARAAVAAGFSSAGLSSAYYAMLYAARAALSEEDRYARTHKGTWELFQRSFIANDRLEAELYADARRAERLRLGADYEAVAVSPQQASVVVEQAARFVAAVEALYAT